MRGGRLGTWHRLVARHREKTAIYKPIKEALHSPADPGVLDFQTWELWENTVHFLSSSRTQRDSEALETDHLVLKKAWTGDLS